MAELVTGKQCFVPKTKEEEEEIERCYEKYKEIISSLPKTKGWASPHHHLYQGFWIPDFGLKGLMWMQQHFKPKPLDVFIMSSPKSGTTWLKALVFSTINRTRFDVFSLNHPLLANSPHDLVPFFELDLFNKVPIGDPDIMPSPRIFASHSPYTSLPDSITKSNTCHIIYMYRNPKDVLVSMWQFMNKIKTGDVPTLSLQDSFDLFCQGVSAFGPFWDHALGYWNASLERPNRVMFGKYEDFKIDTLLHVKKMAEFLGYPFSKEEEGKGVVEAIVELCSFESMKNYEVNKNGTRRHLGNQNSKVKNDVYYRDGRVGSWKNHLTPEMADGIDRISDHKLSASGLSLTLPC